MVSDSNDLFSRVEDYFDKLLFSRVPALIFDNEPNLGAADRGGSLQLWYQSLGLRYLYGVLCGYVSYVKLLNC